MASQLTLSHTSTIKSQTAAVFVEYWIGTSTTAAAERYAGAAAGTLVRWQASMAMTRTTTTQIIAASTWCCKTAQAFPSP